MVLFETQTFYIFVYLGVSNPILHGFCPQCHAYGKHTMMFKNIGCFSGEPGQIQDPKQVFAELQVFSYKRGQKYNGVVKETAFIKKPHTPSIKVRKLSFNHEALISRQCIISQERAQGGIPNSSGNVKKK